MILIGLDFDNTLVKYDNLFHKLALEKKLIKDDLPKNKKIIRDNLRMNGKDEEFTILQGEVYGLRILEAEPAEGMLDTLKKIHQQDIRMVLVSHKTKIPYKGPPYDLHKSAISWLQKYKFFGEVGLNWGSEQVYFEPTKERKIDRIQSLKCTHYIDDLEDILDHLPNEIKRINYNPLSNKTNKRHYVMKRWNIEDILN